MNRDFLLAFLRKQKLSNDEFAKLLGVTPGAVTHWLNGIREIPEPNMRIMMYFADNDLDFRTFHDA